MATYRIKRFGKIGDNISVGLGSAALGAGLGYKLTKSRIGAGIGGTLGAIGGLWLIKDHNKKPDSTNINWKERKEQEYKLKYQKISGISKYHPELLRIEKENPVCNVGDGDEYPSFSISYGSELYKDGTVFLGYQNEPIYELIDDTWYDISYPKKRKVTSIKKDMVSYLNNEIPNYDYKKDNYGWDKEEYIKVTNYLKKLKNSIQNSKLP